MDNQELIDQIVQRVRMTGKPEVVVVRLDRPKFPPIPLDELLLSFEEAKKEVVTLIEAKERNNE